MSDPAPLATVRMLAELEHRLTARHVEAEERIEALEERCKSFSPVATRDDLHKMERRIMADIAQMTADLQKANAQLKKLINDTAGIQPAVDALNGKIADLQKQIADLIAGGGPATQELADSVAETVRLAQVVDDNVPEVTATGR